MIEFIGVAATVAAAIINWLMYVDSRKKLSKRCVDIPKASHLSTQLSQEPDSTQKSEYPLSVVKPILDEFVKYDFELTYKVTMWTGFGALGGALLAGIATRSLVWSIVSFFLFGAVAEFVARNFIMILRRDSILERIRLSHLEKKFLVLLAYAIQEVTWNNPKELMVIRSELLDMSGIDISKLTA